MTLTIEDAWHRRMFTGFPRHQKRFASDVLSRVLHDAMAGKYWTGE